MILFYITAPPDRERGETPPIDNVCVSVPITITTLIDVSTIECVGARGLRDAFLAANRKAKSINLPALKPLRDAPRQTWHRRVHALLCPFTNLPFSFNLLIYLPAEAETCRGQGSCSKCTTRTGLRFYVINYCSFSISVR